MKLLEMFLGGSIEDNGGSFDSICGSISIVYKQCVGSKKAVDVSMGVIGGCTEEVQKIVGLLRGEF